MNKTYVCLCLLWVAYVSRLEAGPLADLIPSPETHSIQGLFQKLESLLQPSIPLQTSDKSLKCDAVKFRKVGDTDTFNNRYIESYDSKNITDRKFNVRFDASTLQADHPLFSIVTDSSVSEHYEWDGGAYVYSINLGKRVTFEAQANMQHLASGSYLIVKKAMQPTDASSLVHYFICAAKP